VTEYVDQVQTNIITISSESNFIAMIWLKCYSLGVKQQSLTLYSLAHLYLKMIPLRVHTFLLLSNSRTTKI